MRVLFALGLLSLSVCTGPTPCQEAKPFTPEQVERDRPEGTVTVTFRVDEVGRLAGLVPLGQYMPILLRTTTNLTDGRSRFYVVLVGKALAIVHRLGIDPGDHFRGTTVEVTGRVTYKTLPRIWGPGGAVEIPADSYVHYEMVIDDLDNFRTVSSPIRSPRGR